MGLEVMSAAIFVPAESTKIRNLCSSMVIQSDLCSLLLHPSLVAHID